ncbi:MAG: substrate-binding domain-containing protein [Chthoniobacterales bacterium]
MQRLNRNYASEVGRVMEMLKPDAIVCANDRTAGHVMQSLLGVNCRIPGDVRIVGVDDVEDASLLPEPLTTVHQPCLEIGAVAMPAMLERVAIPDMPVRDILLDFRLVSEDDKSVRSA